MQNQFKAYLEQVLLPQHCRTKTGSRSFKVKLEQFQRQMRPLNLWEMSPVLFALSHKTNYTHTYEFLWPTAAVSASDKPRAKVWEPSHASDTPRSITWKDGPVHLTKGAHAHTQNKRCALCICQLMQMIRLQMSAGEPEMRGCMWLQRQ